MPFHQLLELAVWISSLTFFYLWWCLWCIESAGVAQSEIGIFWLVFRFLYKQLLLFFDADPTAKDDCIFESSGETHQLQLKPKISLHLYTNQCPEGAAKNFYFKYSSLLLPSLEWFNFHICPVLFKAVFCSVCVWNALVGFHSKTVDLTSENSGILHVIFCD